MTVEIFKSNRGQLSLNRGDQRVIIGTETSKKKRERLMVREGLVDYSKSIDEMGEAMIVISNGGITLSESGKLVVDAHGSGSRLNSEHTLKGSLDFARCGALDHIGQYRL